MPATRPVPDRPLSIAPAARTRIRRKLLAWYDRRRRDLPWRRRGNDPYAQWVAEIMLQQTRVETVIPYYERFLKKFPNVQALASADSSEVLACWAGLGYYRRIEHLHTAARRLNEERRDVPNTCDELRKLPGVGAYTAAAVASIAFGEPRAAVDGNVARVLSRLLGIEESFKSLAGRRRIERAAEALLSRRRPGDFNQAWMDLGSRICTPQSPECPKCPLKLECAARREDRVDRLPVVVRKRRSAEVHVIVGVFQHRGRRLLRRRPPGGLWSEMWEFPNAIRESGKQPEESLREVARNAGVNLKRDSMRDLGVVAHELSHRSYRFHVYMGEVGGIKERNGNGPLRWANAKEMESMALSAAGRKIDRLAAAEPRSSANRRP